MVGAGRACHPFLFPSRKSLKKLVGRDSVPSQHAVSTQQHRDLGTELLLQVGAIRDVDFSETNRMAGLDRCNDRLHDVAQVAAPPSQEGKLGHDSDSC